VCVVPVQPNLVQAGNEFRLVIQPRKGESAPSGFQRETRVLLKLFQLRSFRAKTYTGIRAFLSPGGIPAKGPPALPKSYTPAGHRSVSPTLIHKSRIASPRSYPIIVHWQREKINLESVRNQTKLLVQGTSAIHWVQSVHARKGSSVNFDSSSKWCFV
jgi:hypothetical protein